MQVKGARGEDGNKNLYIKLDLAEQNVFYTYNLCFQSKGCAQSSNQS